jgi:hypothetical protein
MKVQDLENWPPKPGEFFETSPAAPAPELVIVESVLSVRANWIIFSCAFGGDLYPCFFLTKDGTTSLALKAILEANIGKSLFSIGEVEILENLIRGRKLEKAVNGTWA